MHLYRNKQPDAIGGRIWVDNLNLDPAERQDLLEFAPQQNVAVVEVEVNNDGVVIVDNDQLRAATEARLRSLLETWLFGVLRRAVFVTHLIILAVMLLKLVTSLSLDGSILPECCYALQLMALWWPLSLGTIYWAIWTRVRERHSSPS